MGRIIAAISFFTIALISFATEWQHIWESGELIAPTCMNDGSQIYVCKECGEEKSEAAKTKYDGKWIEITGKVIDADGVAGMPRFCYIPV